jgi:hypothetical protein
MCREAASIADPDVALERALDRSALTPMHWKIWWVSAMAVFLTASCVLDAAAQPGGPRRENPRPVYSLRP